MLENTTAKTIRSQDDISKLLMDLGGQEYYPEETGTHSTSDLRKSVKPESGK